MKVQFIVHATRPKFTKIVTYLTKVGTNCSCNIPVDRSCHSVKVTECWLFGSAAHSVIDDFDLFDNMDMFPCTTSTNHEEEENSKNSSARHRNTSRVSHRVKQNENMAWLRAKHTMFVSK